MGTLSQPEIHVVQHGEGSPEVLDWDDLVVIENGFSMEVVEAHDFMVDPRFDFLGGCARDRFELLESAAGRPDGSPLLYLDNRLYELTNGCECLPLMLELSSSEGLVATSEVVLPEPGPKSEEDQQVLFVISGILAGVLMMMVSML